MLQSLPTALTTAQVCELLDTFEALPGAHVERHPSIVTVTATRRATGAAVKVFSAATQDGQHWHAMARPGLITATTH